MKLRKQDTFLIGHTRKMRKLRQRQQQEDPEAHQNRINNQRSEHRLHIRFNVLSENQTR